MNNKYDIIRPPYPLRFRELEREQAWKYFKWFQEQIPIRIQVLTEFVKSFHDYHYWDADFLPTSLDGLGPWFCDRVTTRLRSEGEIDAIYSKAPGWFRNFQAPDYDLSVVTISLSLDVGMYLSQVMVKNVEGLHWEMITKPKKHIDYQQPVLINQHNVEFNPIHIILTYAHGIVRGTKGGDRLRELYEIWANFLRG